MPIFAWSKSAVRLATSRFSDLLGPGWGSKRRQSSRGDLACHCFMKETQLIAKPIGVNFPIKKTI